MKVGRCLPTGNGDITQKTLISIGCAVNTSKPPSAILVCTTVWWYPGCTLFKLRQRIVGHYSVHYMHIIKKSASLITTF